jgi:DUF971 family protein
VAGLQPGASRPTEIKLHQRSRVLEIAFDDGKSFRLECELLRVYSPSAEVRGHGPGQEVLQTGKKDVEITAVEPVPAQTRLEKALTFADKNSSNRRGRKGRGGRSEMMTNLGRPRAIRRSCLHTAYVLCIPTLQFSFFSWRSFASSASSAVSA